MVRLRLFGHPALETGESRKPLGLSAKGVAAIALITADAEHPLSRDWLAQKLWPDIDPSQARANLRRQLHLAVKVLGDDALSISRETVQWNAAGQVAADVVAFDAVRTADPAAAVEQYAGELCAGIPEDALEGLRIRYRSQYEYLLRVLLEQARAAADDEASRIWLERLIQHDPLDEQAVRDLMRLRLINGDRAGALRDYAALRQRMLSEIGAEPQPETSALVGGAATGDGPVPNNLSASTTSFVGREREIAEIEAALHGVRMIALVGPGGAGKSRLAARCSRKLLPQYCDGVWFVDLEHAKSESDVWEMLGNAVRAPAAQPMETSALDFLRDRSSLIVLDTCEHVITAAQRVAEKLLSGTRAHILATSRHSMTVSGARQIAIDALDAAAARQLFLERASAVNPAFRLDKERESSLAALLERIDGLPLAIELLASRANVLSIEGMRARMTQTLQSPIAETLKWSYELLSKSQRRLFESLAAFRGTFTPDDVKHMQDGDQPGRASLFELVEASLVSEVGGRRGIRYRLLETTRAFAESRLRESSRMETVLSVHARQFAEKADVLAATPETDFPAVLDTLTNAMPDYFAAFEYAARHGSGSIGVRLIEGLYRFAMRGHFTQQISEHAAALLSDSRIAGAHRARIARLTAIVEENQHRAAELFRIAADYYRDDGDEVRYCDTINGLAATYWHMGNYEECERLLLEARTRMENGGDRRVLLKTLGRLVTLYTTLGGNRYDEAVAILPGLVRELQELGEVRQAAQLVKNLAAGAYFTHRYDDALGWAQNALELTSATSEMAMRLNVLTLCGAAEQERGNLRAAAAWHLRACEAVPLLGECAEVAESLEDVAGTLAVLGSAAEAASIAGYAQAIRTRIAFTLNPNESSAYERMLARLHHALGPRFSTAWASGTGASLRDMCALARRALESHAGPAPTQDNEDTTSLS